MKRILFVALLAAGCAGPSVRRVMGPDGSPHFAVRCGSMTTCYERAQTACPVGYEIVDKGASTHSTPIVQSSFKLGVPPTYAGSTTSTTNTMLIRCRVATASR